MRVNRRKKRKPVVKMGNCCPATQQLASAEERKRLLVDAKAKEGNVGKRKGSRSQMGPQDKLQRDGDVAAPGDAHETWGGEGADGWSDADPVNPRSCVEVHKESKAEEEHSRDASLPHVNNLSCPVEDTHINNFDTSVEDQCLAGKIADASSTSVDKHKDKCPLEVEDKQTAASFEKSEVFQNSTISQSDTQAEHPSSSSLSEDASAEHGDGDLLGDPSSVPLEADVTAGMCSGRSLTDSSGEKSEADMPKKLKTKQRSTDENQGGQMSKKDAESSPVKSDACKEERARNSQAGSAAVSDPSSRYSDEQPQGGKQDFGGDASKTDAGSRRDSVNKSSAKVQEVPANQNKGPPSVVREEPMKGESGSNEMEEDSSEVDLYRGVEEIEEERLKKEELQVQESVADALLTLRNTTCEPEDRSSVAAEVDLLFYSQMEWRGNTAKSALIRKGYEEVSHTFQSLRRVRGDNYCALRATLFQVLSQDHPLPDWLQQGDIAQWPEELLATEELIGQWRFPLDHRDGDSIPSSVEQLKLYLNLLRKRWHSAAKARNPQERHEICEEVFQGGEEEYGLLEAVKFLMLRMAMELHGRMLRDEPVPVFCWLLFARDSSDCPRTFLTNHLCHVGFSGGLEQVEMFLLGYTLQRTIKVYRLYKTKTQEFVTYYPDDHKEDWPHVCLVTEDDRHYNIPVVKREKES